MKINKTSDYANFQYAPENRDVRKITKLVRSMKLYGWLPSFPMLCSSEKSGKKTILDGQNRFEAAKNLKIPVLYVCLEEGAKVSIPQINNAASPWNMRDYLSSFCRQGNADYIQIKEFCDSTGIRLTAAIAMFAGATGGGNHSESFKQGVFKIKNVALPTTVGDLVMFMKEQIKWASDSLLVQAITRACFVKDFKAAVFKQKVASNPGMLRKQPNLESYTELVEEIYNFRSHCQIPLKFLIEQEMRRRNFATAKKA